MSLCLVCAAPGAAKHYGSLCCSGCKGFFRRSVRFRKSYSCPREQNCPINKKYRNSCRACRFQKCLAVGMDPRLVQGDWGLRHDGSESPPSLADDARGGEEIAEEGAEGRRQPEGSAEQAEGRRAEGSAEQVSGSAGHELVRHDRILNASAACQRALGFVCAGSGPASSSSSSSSASPADSLSVANFFVAIERLCDLYVDAPERCSIRGPEPNLEVPVQVAYKQPGMICGRSPMAWSDSAHIQLGVFSRAYSRLLVHYFDWASHLPEFGQFSEQDRLNLIIRRSFRCTWLLVSFRSVLFNFNGIPLSCDRFYPFDSQQQLQLEPQLREMFAETIGMAMRGLVRPLRDLGVSESEYALLRVLCFFVPVPWMSREGRQLLRRAREKYLGVLTDLVRARSGGNEWAPEGLRRMNQLLMMLVRVEYSIPSWTYSTYFLCFLDLLPQIAQMDDNAFSMLTAFNIAQMRGTLTYEMHLRNS